MYARPIQDGRCPLMLMVRDAALLPHLSQLMRESEQDLLLVDAQSRRAGGVFAFFQVG